MKFEADVLFVRQGNVIFELSECFVGECLEDSETVFFLGIYVICI